MDYYDNLLDKIKKYIENKEYLLAKDLILEELSVHYIPKDIEVKLNEYLYMLPSEEKKSFFLSEEKIVEYLNGNDEHQILAVDELNKRNLRDYIEIVSDYLKSKGNKNAKALLIDSLIKQEINADFEYVNNGLLLTFNPKNLKSCEETDGFKVGKAYLDEYYMKDPSKLEMAISLLYKEAMLYLPKQANKKEGLICANKIITYIEDAFSAK